MARKPLTVSKAKVRVWTAMSRYIRTKYLREDGLVECVTCGQLHEYKKIHAGHWIPAGRGNSTRFVETNVHPQCFRCNVNLGSNGPEYYKFMLATYGQQHVDELILLSHQVMQFRVPELLELEQYYINKLADLGDSE